jgi:hypothetical protein
MASKQEEVPEMTRHQKRTLAAVPALAVLSTVTVCDGQPLTGPRPAPLRRTSPLGLTTIQAPQLRGLIAPNTAAVLPAAANFTEVDGQKTVTRSLLFTPEDAQRTKTRSLLFTPEDQRRTVWRFAATGVEQKPVLTHGPAGLQSPRR